MFRPALLASVLALAAPADAQAAPPVVGCATHVEPSVAAFDPERDIVRGPFALIGVAGDLRTPSRRGRPTGVKLPVGLRAGHRATLSVRRSQRRHAALIFREETREAERIGDGDRAVTFEPCAADAPAFTGGTVGPITGWAGALMVSGRRCIRLDLRVDGQRRRPIALPVGRRC